MNSPSPREGKKPEAPVLRLCTEAQAPEILAIFNDAIVHSTALYDYKPRTPADMEAWFAAKRAGGFPVIGAFGEDGSLVGFGSFGAFRAFPAYKYTVEHSVYVRADRRGGGIGRRLLEAVIEAARRDGRHTLIGVIDAQNAGSIRLHRSLGFEAAGRLREAGFKFGRWLDVEFYQLLLATPTDPRDG